MKFSSLPACHHSAVRLNKSYTDIMAACKVCELPLFLNFEPDDVDVNDTIGQLVPDDVELLCNCHFHW